MEASIHFNTTDKMVISNHTIINEDEEYIFGSINCFIYLFCSIFSIILNLALILNWIFVFKKDKYADFLLISMASADLIIGSLTCPFDLIKKLSDMSLISSLKISKTSIFVKESIEYAAWLNTFLSLFLLSWHRFKQLISPFKESAMLNKLRIVILTSKWLILPPICFFIIWCKTFTQYKDLIEFLHYLSGMITNVSVFILNILIILKFKSKLKNTKLNKNNFKYEKKAILCTFVLTLQFLKSLAPYFIVIPFVILKFKFVESLHDIYYSFGYFYIVADPLTVLIFNKKFRIKCNPFTPRNNIQSSIFSQV